MDGAVVRRALFNLVSELSVGHAAQFGAWIRAGRFESQDGSVDYRARLAAATVPALLLAGAADALAPPASVAAAYEALGSPDKTYAVLGTATGCAADYGHGDLLLGRHAPEEVYPRIARWLEAHARRRRRRRGPAGPFLDGRPPDRLDSKTGVANRSGLMSQPTLPHPSPVPATPSRLGLIALAAGLLLAAGCGRTLPDICHTDSDCAPGTSCVAQRCRPAGGPVCGADTDCPGQQLCQGGQCVSAPACLTDADCPTGQHCLDGSCATSLRLQRLHRLPFGPGLRRLRLPAGLPGQRLRHRLHLRSPGAAAACPWPAPTSPASPAPPA